MLPCRAILGRVMGAFESTAGLSPLWTALKRADAAAVSAAIASGADVNERVDGLTPLHFIARKGHYQVRVFSSFLGLVLGS